MPIVNSVKEDMIPDLLIEFNEHAVLFAEEDSHKCKNGLRSIIKACIYANFHCRYLATHNVKSPGICIHFPSAHSEAKDTRSSAAIIQCAWSYEKFCFVYSATALDLDTLKDTITALVDELIALQFHERDMATLYYVFKLDIGKVSSTPLFRNAGWTCNSQLLSGTYALIH